MLETITASRFKAICLALLDQVKQTGQAIVITKHGKPVAQLVPPPAPETAKGGFGCMAGTFEELGDIVEPLGTDDWEVLSEEPI